MKDEILKVKDKNYEFLGRVFSLPDAKIIGCLVNGCHLDFEYFVEGRQWIYAVWNGGGKRYIRRGNVFFVGVYNGNWFGHSGCMFYIPNTILKCEEGIHKVKTETPFKWGGGIGKVLQCKDCEKNFVCI